MNMVIGLVLAFILALVAYGLLVAILDAAKNALVNTTRFLISGFSKLTGTK